MTLYDDGFYDQITEGSVRSARKVVPWVKDIFNVNSVMDFGCGTGAWLSVFAENGCDTVLGFDGNYVDRNRLLISQNNFIPWDLSEGHVPSYTMLQPCDLAMSLEVAEHLPESSADAFVETLCRASNNILFSAAVPGQNGVNHINEQWASYWVPKFESYGYQYSATFRFEFWHDEDVENWYRQNIFLFSTCDSISDEDYKRYFEGPQPLDVIHYNNWMGKI